MIEGIFAIFCILIGAFFTFLFSRENTDCNSTYIRNGHDCIETPVFEVWKIEKRINSKFEDVARYYIKSYYLEGSENCERKELTFYDKIGKYQIGDELELIGSKFLKDKR